MTVNRQVDACAARNECGVHVRSVGIVHQLPKGVDLSSRLPGLALTAPTNPAPLLPAIGGSLALHANVRGFFVD